jgi:hypothetical protein
LGVGFLPGNANCLSFDWKGSLQGYGLSLTYEGHTDLSEFKTSPVLIVSLVPGNTPNNGLKIYIKNLVDAGFLVARDKKIPSWWRDPVFCGWGEQRLAYRKDHDGHEFGNWINAGDYSCEELYENSLEILENKGINPGIVVIDCFWAKKSIFADPHDYRWPHMRRFIDNQHAKGRKVLLWFTPILFDGLPLEACMTLEGKPVASDPSSESYKCILDREIRKMIDSGEGCLNADGFKIDFTQDIPSERGIFRNILKDKWAIISESTEKNYPSLENRNSLVMSEKPIWGLELVKAYLNAIVIPMKECKEDALLIAHGANPYLNDQIDMLRLNDLDGVSPDILDIMRNRAEISSSCNPNWLIDTDNDLMTSKSMWRKYMKVQLELGNPDTYYATGIAQSGETFDEDDYALLAEVFKNYRQQLDKFIYACKAF